MPTQPPSQGPGFSVASRGFSRRDFLWQTGGGLGGVALAWMLGEGKALADTPRPRPEWNGGLHYPAKVRRIVQLFMNGGVSQMDTFDYKPELIKRHGQKVDFGIKAAVTSTPGRRHEVALRMEAARQVRPLGQQRFPALAGCVDDLAFLMAMASKTNVHGPASYMQNTGFRPARLPLHGRVDLLWAGQPERQPARRSWCCPTHAACPTTNAGNFSSGFLPMAHQGTVIRPNAPMPIPNLLSAQICPGNHARRASRTGWPYSMH